MAEVILLPAALHASAAIVSSSMFAELLKGAGWHSTEVWQAEAGMHCTNQGAEQCQIMVQHSGCVSAGHDTVAATAAQLQQGCSWQSSSINNSMYTIHRCKQYQGQHLIHYGTNRVPALCIYVCIASMVCQLLFFCSGFVCVCPLPIAKAWCALLPSAHGVLTVHCQSML